MFNLKKTSLTVASVLLLVSIAFVSSADYQHQAFLKASNPDIVDRFSYGAVAISGDTLVVGARFEASGTTGVNGDESNNDAFQAGAAYVFTRMGGEWTQQAYLKASNTEFNDFFGYSVAISGDTIIVGAPQEDSSDTGINGDDSDNNAASSGAAYIFTRNAGVWSQQAYLKASNTNAADFFGWSVAISGDKVVVGSSLEDSDATGANGDDSNNNTFASGAAYVFSRVAGIWSQEAYLKASNTDEFDNFGYAVAISNRTIIVGAKGEESGSTGINGDQNNNDASESGAAYIFNFNFGSWQQQAYLKASNTDALDWFGSAVDISGEIIVIGADREDSSSIGVSADESNNGSGDSGAAYVFTRVLGNWLQQAYLKASNTDAGDSFGTSVSVSGTTIVIGALNEDSASFGVDGDDSNNNNFDAGAAYIFNRHAAIWQQQHYLKPEFPDDHNNFGGHVAVAGNSVVASEHNEGFIVLGSGATHVFNQPNSFALNVTVTGLLGGGLVLQNNGTDNLSILNNGNSQFAIPLANGSSYQVTINNQPNNSNHSCLIEGNHSGIISSAPVWIKVRCADFIFVDGFD